MLILNQIQVKSHGFLSNHEVVKSNRHIYE